MRTILATTILLLAGGCASNAALPQPAAPHAPAIAGPAAGTWIQGAPGHTEIVVDTQGDTYIGIWLDVPDQTPAHQVRTPMAVSLVVDTSGSMSGDKITNARMAAASVLESLVDGDVVSIYGFSNTVREIAPPTVVSPSTRAGLMQQTRYLSAQGGTNMWDGMRAGLDRVSRAPTTHSLRRVFIISDGQANIGPSDPVSLGNLAANATEYGTQITAIGVGYDYDQETLSALAVRSSGRLYHLSQPHQMAHILEQELSLLSRSVAVNAYIEVTPAPGVVLLEGMTTGAQLDDGRVRFPLGAIYAGQRRELLVRARIDAKAPGRHGLATARLVYERPDAADAGPQAQAVDMHYQGTRDRAAAQGSKTPRVWAMVAEYQATQAQRRASELMRQGQGSQAAAVLDQAQHQLSVEAAAAPPAMQERLKNRAKRISSDRDSARAAKSAEEMNERAYDMADDAMEAEGY